jgi:hypothetical protein
VHPEPLLGIDGLDTALGQRRALFRRESGRGAEKPPAGAEVPDGEVGQGHHELVDVLALLADAQKPPPGDGDGLGDGVGPLAGAA